MGEQGGRDSVWTVRTDVSDVSDLSSNDGDGRHSVLSEVLSPLPDSAKTYASGSTERSIASEPSTIRWSTSEEEEEDQEDEDEDGEGEDDPSEEEQDGVSEEEEAYADGGAREPSQLIDGHSTVPRHGALTWQHTAVRIGALCELILPLEMPAVAQRTTDLVPAALALLLSLMLVLTRLILEPLYNTLPLTLHPEALYASLTIAPAILLWYPLLCQPLREAIHARVCVCVAAIAGDLVAVSARRVGSLAGQIAGAEWGGWAARVILGVGVVGGGAGFALLCSVSGSGSDGSAKRSASLTLQDYVVPTTRVTKPANGSRLFLDVLLRCAIFVAHVWLGERAWMAVLSGSTSRLVQHPEKSVRPKLRRCLEKYYLTQIYRYWGSPFSSP